MAKKGARTAAVAADSLAELFGFKPTNGVAGNSSAVLETWLAQGKKVFRNSLTYGSGVGTGVVGVAEEGRRAAAKAAKVRMEMMVHCILEVSRRWLLVVDCIGCVVAAFVVEVVSIEWKHD